MTPSANPSLALVVVLVVSVLAGCTGVGTPDSPTTGTTATSTAEATASPSTTATTTVTPVETTTPSPSNATAKERALDAEETRVGNLLANASNVSGAAGAYGRTEAAVLGREDGVVRVRVVSPTPTSTPATGVRARRTG